MRVFARIAEQRIEEAINRGELDSLPNAGRPLQLDDETWIPEDLRMAYRLLKNAGYVPPELELHNQIISLKKLMDELDDDAERLKRLRELNFKILKFEQQTGRTFDWEQFPRYEGRLYDRVLSDEEELP